MGSDGISKYIPFISIFYVKVCLLIKLRQSEVTRSTPKSARYEKAVGRNLLDIVMRTASLHIGSRR